MYGSGTLGSTPDETGLWIRNSAFLFFAVKLGERKKKKPIMLLSFAQCFVILSMCAAWSLKNLFPNEDVNQTTSQTYLIIQKA